jgi:nucleoside-diphosphate-sugar epimerase
MSVSEMPVSGFQRHTRFSRDPETPVQPSILISGASGVIGTILAQRLHQEFRLVALDPEPVHDQNHWCSAVSGSVADRPTVLELARKADYILHLAHGARSGWQGLVEVDISGTRNVLDGAIQGGCRRVVSFSSNHVTGWDELDRLAGRSDGNPLSPTAPARPDGLYGVAKVAGEALGRSASEAFALPVSVLRVGTVRLHANLEEAGQEPGFAYIGSSEEILARLRRSWLTHSDLEAKVREELAAPETFRCRFAVSSNIQQVWSQEVGVWHFPGDHSD